jgi:hypothetical protein
MWKHRKIPETDRDRYTSQLMEHSTYLLDDSGLPTRETDYCKKKTPDDT